MMVTHHWAWSKSNGAPCLGLNGVLLSVLKGESKGQPVAGKGKGGEGEGGLHTVEGVVKVWRGEKRTPPHSRRTEP